MPPWALLRTWFTASTKKTKQPPQWLLNYRKAPRAALACSQCLINSFFVLYLPQLKN